MPRHIALGLTATLAATIGMAGCTGYSNGTVNGTTSGLTSSGNHLTDGVIGVNWSVEDSWEQGACVAMTIENQGAALDWWDITLRLDGDFETWLGGYGAASFTTWDPSTVSIFPDDGHLAAGASVQTSYCTEPAVFPRSIAATTSFSQSTGSSSGGGSSSGSSGGGSSSGSGSGSGSGWGGSSSGSSSGSGSSGSGSSGSGSSGSSGGGDGPYGGFLSNGWGLDWTDAGDSNGGQCLELTFLNLSGDTFEDWSAIIQLDQAADVTNAWNIDAFSFGTSQLWVFPQDWAGTDLDNNESYTGSVCFSPDSEPIDMVVYGTSDSGSGTSSEPLAGSVLDADDMIGIRWTDGGTTADETCLNMQLVNLSGLDVVDWTADIEMDAATVITRSWSVDAWGFGTTDVSMLSQDWHPGLDAGETLWAGMCMTEPAQPVSIDFHPTF
jgi:hypothetical protein